MYIEILINIVNKRISIKSNTGILIRKENRRTPIISMQSVNKELSTINKLILKKLEPFTLLNYVMNNIEKEELWEYLVPTIKEINIINELLFLEKAIQKFLIKRQRTYTKAYKPSELFQLCNSSNKNILRRDISNLLADVEWYKREEQIIEDIIYFIGTFRVLQCETEDRPNGETRYKINERNIMPLIWAEVYYYIKNDIYAKQCPTCGKYFIPVNQKRIYCNEYCKEQMRKVKGTQ